MSSVIDLQAVHKVYRTGGGTVAALQNIDLSIDQGEFVAVVGASGSGKSTLLHILGCLDRPTSGRYTVLGRQVSGLSDDELSFVRNRALGFVFQSFNLLMRLNALGNVALPLRYRGVAPRERHDKALRALGAVGLEDRWQHRPNQLSGGQQQRVAIARALVTEPALILADEPTGNLDSQSGQEVLQLFKGLHQGGHTIVLVTHDAAVANQATRQVEVRDGQIVRDTGR